MTFSVDSGGTIPVCTLQITRSSKLTISNACNIFSIKKCLGTNKTVYIYFN